MSRKTWALISNWKFNFGNIDDGFKTSLDDSGFKEVSIPHDWAVSRPVNAKMENGGQQGFLDRWGVGWYRRNIHIGAPDPNKTYLLEFDGVYENSTVWLNEKQVGGKGYGYSGFCIDVTDAVKPGDNLLAVKVDNTTVPADRWYSGAGIYRNVRLIETGKTRIAQNGVMLTTEVKDGAAIVSVEADIITFGIFPAVLSGKVLSGGVVAASAEGTAGGKSLTLRIEAPRLWDAENPNLYTLSLSLAENGAETDSVALKFGVRSIEFIPQKGMFVNGKMTKLKGVCLHHDAGGIGSAVPEWAWRKRLSVLKEIGCNAIRTSHNIASPEFMDLCDELGFYVLDECFDKWVSGYYKRYFESSWKEDLLFMLRRDRYRPSVVIWSVGNEVERQGEESMIEILRELLAFVKENEPTRPATLGLAPAYFYGEPRMTRGGETGVALTKNLAKEMEILGCNYHEPWYEDYHEAYPDQLILGTENFLYFRGSWEDCHSYCSPNPWMAVEDHDYVIGAFLWAGADYLGESSGLPSKGWPSGLLATNNVRKPISYLFESYWSDKPMIHFTAYDMTQRDDFGREHWMYPTMASHWNFEQFYKNVIPYGVFSSCEEIELYVNGRLVARQKPADWDSRIVTGYVPWGGPGEVRAVGKNGGKAVCEHKLVTAGVPARLELSIDRDSIKSDRQDICYAEVKILDKDGNLCHKAANGVRFVVQGAGAIAAVDNGDLLCRTPYVSDAAPMFRGHCSAIIKSNGEKGVISVSVYGDGLMSDSKSLSAE